MRNILLILAFLIGGIDASYGAAPRVAARSGRAVRTTANNANNTVVGRSAAKPVNNNNSDKSDKSVGARAAAKQPATQKVRAGTKQSVIGTGTKVASAGQNTVVDEECWSKFSGCMDSFCMLDNASGGRCICSDKNAEYDSILAEIQELDNQSYQMATVGVERIEMGDDADAIMARTKNVTKSIEKEAESAKSKRKSLDLSSWNTLNVDFDAEEEDVFSLGSDGMSVVNKTGDALYRASAKLCETQLKECSSQNKMMELMYQQRIRSDCAAYENSLRQQRTQSAQKLAAAQSAMREAALEQYRSANKYDLGQCTIEFKKCMQTTGGCGDDFTGCITQQTTRQTLIDADKVKQKKIKGASTTIEIAAWSYDALESKKPLCMTVTQQCVNVRDQVWDTFLREVAPQVKSAELAAESNMRMSCISSISDCFQKACKENMDPNNPEGSYDMCLTRPETLGAVCKVQIEPCEKINANIMDYVKARLASMRVDSCTKEFKDCLQSEDRCGEDYSQCVGLDTETIVNLCPAEKLVGCQYKDGEEDRDVYSELSRIAQGIFLNVDNSLLKSCQKAVQNKVVEVCGSLSECDAFVDDENIGTDSLMSYKNNKGDTVIEGLVNFGLLQINDNNTDIDLENYKVIRKAADQTISNDILSELQDKDATEQRIYASINTVANKAKQKIAVINTDPTIDMCINGRGNAWKKGRDDGKQAFQRFPHLLDSYNLMIFNSALDKSYSNYRKRLDELVSKAVEDQNDDVKSMLCTAIAYDEGSSYCEAYRADEITGEAVCTKYGAHGALGDIFGNGSDELGMSDNGLAIVIKGADISKKLANMTQGKGEFIQTDNEGNMIGSMTITSMYNAENNTCSVTTISAMCKNLEVIKTITEVGKMKGDVNLALSDDMSVSTSAHEYTAKNKSTSGVGLDVIGHKSNKRQKVKQSKVKKLKTEVYRGTYCSEFQEPTTQTDYIKL